MKLGLDIGFGDVKFSFVAGDELNQLKFPTAVTTAKNGVDGLGSFGEQTDEYEYNGKRYMLGQDAMIDAFSTRSFSFLLNFAPLFAYKAVQTAEKVSGQTVTHIAIGLPVAFFNAQNEASFRTTLSNIHVNGQQRTFVVSVFPQGVGVLMDYRLDNDGSFKKDNNAQDLIILDIGFNTVDVVVVSNGKALRGESGMFEKGGISKIAVQLQQKLQQEMSITLSEQEAKAALRAGSIRHYGVMRDLSAIIHLLTVSYVEGLILDVQSRWENRISKAEQVVIAGGGAYYVKEHLPEAYKYLIYTPALPEFSNSRGFMKIINIQG